MRFSAGLFRFFFRQIINWKSHIQYWIFRYMEDHAMLCYEVNAITCTLKPILLSFLHCSWMFKAGGGVGRSSTYQALAIYLFGAIDPLVRYLFLPWGVHFVSLCVPDQSKLHSLYGLLYSGTYCLALSLLSLYLQRL